MPLSETTDVLSKIAAGVIYGSSAVNVIGYNGGVTTSAETIWDESSAYTFLTAAMSAPYIASANVNDAAAGTGARTVRVTLVNTSFVQSTEDLTLNGQTGVSLVTANVLSIQKVEVLTAGSGLVNAGIIRIGTGVNTAGVPAVVHANVPAGLNASRHGFYVVPASNILLIQHLRVASGSATAGAITASIKEASGLTGLVMEKNIIMGTNNDSISVDFKVPLAFPAQTKLNFQVISSAGTGPASLLANCVLCDLTSTTGKAKWI